MRNFARKIVLMGIALIFSANISFAQNEFGGVIKFDKMVHNFGDILISDGEQKCQFSYTNISDKPIVVHRVITSCGCTEPEWDLKPLRPGEKGVINISFKNDQGPYPFDKGITVYVSDVNKPIVLRIRGVAHNKKKTPEEMFPQRFGPVGVKSKLLGLGQIEQGMARNESVEMANLSSKEVSVTFSNVTPGLKIGAVKIPPKGKVQVPYVVDTKSLDRKLWGKTIFSANVVVNGVPQGGCLEVETLIKENFSSYTPEQMKAGALPKFATSSAALGTLKRGTVKNLSFTFTNMGKESMKIYKLDSSDPGCTFKYPESVAPGAKGVIEVSVDTSGVEGEMLYVLSVITNSPTRPVVNLFITGEIEN